MKHLWERSTPKTWTPFKALTNTWAWAELPQLASGEDKVQAQNTECWQETWFPVENVEVEAASEKHGDEGSDPVHGKHGKHA